MADKELKDIEQVAQRVSDAHGFLHIDDKTAQLTALDAQIAQAGFWDDAQRAQTVSKQASSLRDTIDAYNAAVSLLDDARAAHELAGEDPLFAEEVQQTLEALDGKLDALEVESWFSGRFDDGDCILTVSPGQGGLEAQDWTEMLYNMYSRYAESRRWQVEILSANEGEHGGFKEVIAKFSGDGVYGRLKFESGGHRVQRVPATESQGRIHTSACTVAVMPELPEAEMPDINPADLRIDTFRSSGAGGQHVNTTDSAIRITHLPTGIVVECQDERSQHKNKAKALSVLGARIRAAEVAKRQQAEASTRRNLLGSGDRSDRNRTYNFPQGRVTDHRINLTLYRLDETMEGKLDMLIEPIVQEYQADQLAALSEQE